MSTLDLCLKYFGTRDAYEVLKIKKDALPKDVKKAYYKLSLQVHPDRAKEEDKEISTEKFKVLSKVYQVLSDKEKRALYDEQGLMDDDDDMEWIDYWRKLFKPITVEDIENYEANYVNSELERTDIKKAYLSTKGCINLMMNEVPFLKVSDEPRLQEIVRKMIDEKEVPEYKIFTKEPAAKRNRRHNKYARESKEAAELKKEIEARNAKRNATSNGSGSLEQQLMERHKSRESNFDNFMDRLTAKYGNDDSEVIELKDLGKRSNKKKASEKKSKGRSEDDADEKLHKVTSGKVKKRYQK